MPPVALVLLSGVPLSSKYQSTASILQLPFSFYGPEISSLSIFVFGEENATGLVCQGHDPSLWSFFGQTQHTRPPDRSLFVVGRESDLRHETSNKAAG
jgi:hypothetical protein